MITPVITRCTFPVVVRGELCAHLHAEKAAIKRMEEHS